jgi:hypothetical protein
MSTFPVLKTGAVIQVPTSRTMQFATDVVQFMDGTEQRYCEYALPYHSWIVKFNALDDGELQNIRAFVQQMNGAAGLFSFTDPWDETVYPTCSLQGDTVTDSLTGPFQTGTSLSIRENRT